MAPDDPAAHPLPGPEVAPPAPSSPEVAPPAPSSPKVKVLLPSSREVGAPFLGSIGAALGQHFSPEHTLGIPVRTAAQGYVQAVASSNTTHLVAWRTHPYVSHSTHFARVSADGDVLDPDGLLTLEHPCEALASDGHGFLAVAPAGNELLGFRISQLGRLLDPGGFAIGATRAGTQSAVAFGGGRYLVAWKDQVAARDPSQPRFHAALVTPGGVRVGSTIELPDTWGDGVKVASDGDDFLLTWTEAVPAYQNRLVGARISAAGVLLDPDGFQIGPSFGQRGNDILHTLNFDGSNYVQTWVSETDEDSFMIQGARVTPQGDVLDPAGIEIVTHTESELFAVGLGAAFDGADTVIGWTSTFGAWDGHPWYSGVEIARLSPQGVLVGSPALSGLDAGLGVAASSGGAGTFFTWSRQETPSNYEETLSVVGARFGASGAPLDPPTGIPISTYANHLEVKDAAFDGNLYLVIWVDDRDELHGGRGLFGARVSRSGQRLDSDGFRIGNGLIDDARVTFDGSNFAVVWAESKWDQETELRFARVSPGGALLDPAPILIPLYYYETRYVPIAIASDGAGTLVGYAGDAVRVSQEGVPGTPYQFGPAGRYTQPAFAFGGGNYLATWSQNGFHWGQRLNSDGAPIDAAPFAIATLPPLWEREPAVSFGGGNYLAVWTNGSDLLGARISPAGEVLDPTSFLIGSVPENTDNGTWYCNEGGDGICPSVVFDGTDFVVAWRAWTAVERSAELVAARVTTSGSVLPSFTFAAASGPKGTPVLAASDSRELLAAYTRVTPHLPYDARVARFRMITP